MNKKQTGFTIVELLIVIVVIGILAAITIVSFNGVQDRAQATKVITQASAIVKGLKVWEAEVGTRPNVASCIAPASAVTNGTTCPAADHWQTDAPYNTSFNTDLMKYAGLSTIQLGKWGYNTPAGSMWYHGNYWNDGRSVLQYAVGPTTDCGIPNVLSLPYSEMTLSGAKFTSRDAFRTECIIEVSRT